MERTTGPINIANGTSVAIADVVTHLCKAAQFQGKVVYQTDKPTGIRDRSVNVARLRSLGLSPKTSLEDGLAKTYSWFVANVASARGANAARSW